MVEFNDKFFQEQVDAGREANVEKTPKGQSVNFQELSKEHEEWLRKRIEKSKGRIIVCIHPFYPAERLVHAFIQTPERTIMNMVV